MGQYQINIELSSHRLLLKYGGIIKKIYPVAIGKKSTPTPIGNHKILKKIKNPGGVLGTRWMQFTKRVHGIHGTNKPWLIGQSVSNGCVRMYNNNVEELYDLVKIGTAVIIKNKFTQNYNQGYFLYTVKKGDSLWLIAQKYNNTVHNIKQINKLKTNLIYPGQKLKIPQA